jgi:hypothetical protein
MKFYATNINGMTGKIGQLLTQTMKYSSITGRQYLSVKHSIDRLHPTKKNLF